MENMEIYEQVRKCPDNALKPITAGRLKGKSDINPMWRIKKLTELFGVVGVGWYYEITKQWVEPGANGEMAAFCNINLFINVGGEWSKPIQGTGGSSFITKERNGFYTSDECFKMALTDAISVACKALGFAADVYWNNDRTKYSMVNQSSSPSKAELSCCICGKPFKGLRMSDGTMLTAEEVYEKSKAANGKPLCAECRKAGK